MQALASANPALKPFLIESKSGRSSINFSDDRAVKELNRALLIHHYHIQYWDIPDGHLCPPIPGRVDYLLGVKDALAEQGFDSALKSEDFRALDIGTGANLIYPIVGHGLFDWQWVATDIEQSSLENAQIIVDKNPELKEKIELRLQANSGNIFDGVIHGDEFFHISCCNPPFHKSAKEAMAGSIRKNKNLARNKTKRKSNVRTSSSDNHLNFSGKSNELWCKGGELAFVKTMIKESRDVSDRVGLFTCLISKKDNLSPIYAALKEQKVSSFKAHDMQQGSKISRFISWKY